MATTCSVVAHAALLAAIFGNYASLLDKIDEPIQRPDITITLDRLESDTLAGILEQEGTAGADGAEDVEANEVDETLEATEPDALDPETVEGVEEPETLEAAEPEVAEEIPEELEAEIPEAVTAEALEPEDNNQPEAIEAIDPLDSVEAEEIAALDPADSLVAEEVAPLPTAETIIAPEPTELSPISPIAGSDGGVAASLPQAATALTAITPTGDTGLEPVASAPATLPAAPTIEDEAEVVTALNTTTPPPQPPKQVAPSAQPQSEQDLAIGNLISRIRSANLDPCLLAMPRRDGTDGVGIALIASDDTAMANFGNEVLTEPGDGEFRQTRTLVDQRQCPALAFVKRSAEYPATRLGLRIENPELPSGESLVGTIRGISGRYVSLFLVDNNGVMQDLQRFLTYSGNFARFEVPVNRVGGLRDTKQMLIAVGTQAPHTELKEKTGLLAQDAFANLTGELRGSMALAVSTFDVR